MKAILTGITGNLGHEAATELLSRGFGVIPVVRSKKRLLSQFSRLDTAVIENDLMSEKELDISQSADCIVHCAGIVRFKNTENANQKMMLKVLELAKKLRAPLYYVSTAFLYKPEAGILFNNDYEIDKWKTEQIFFSSKVPGAILRPSILTGNSKSGEIQNFSGYYLVVQALLSAIKNSMTKGRKLRFPILHGRTNIVPADQAARALADTIQNLAIGIFYATNPEPPSFAWLFDQTLEYFNLSQEVDFLDCPFDDFGQISLTDEEKKLFQFTKNFSPYWSMNYNFPDSFCKSNLVDGNYIRRILNYYQRGVQESN